MVTACPTRGTWFVKFVRGEKLSKGVISKKEFGISTFTLAAIQRKLDMKFNHNKRQIVQR